MTSPLSYAANMQRIMTKGLSTQGPALAQPYALQKEKLELASSFEVFTV